jgi:hypothetical protein
MKKTLFMMSAALLFPYSASAAPYSLDEVKALLEQPYDVFCPKYKEIQQSIDEIVKPASNRRSGIISKEGWYKIFDAVGTKNVCFAYNGNDKCASLGPSNGFHCGQALREYGK